MKLLKKVFSKQENAKELYSVIIVAAGSSSRMEGQDKILYPLGGIPVIVRSILPFEHSDLVDEIILVVREESIADIAELCKQYVLSKVVKIVVGGKSRTQSVQAGLTEVSPDAEYVAIHDGARPFVKNQIVESTFQKAEQTGACIPAIAVKDTIKCVEDDVIINTPKREELFAAQTPQVFEKNLICVAINKALEKDKNITDDASAVEQLGYIVSVVHGSEENMKLTTKDDLLLAEFIAERSGWF